MGKRLHPNKFRDHKREGKRNEKALEKKAIEALKTLKAGIQKAIAEKNPHFFYRPEVNGKDCLEAAKHSWAKNPLFAASLLHAASGKKLRTGERDKILFLAHRILLEARGKGRDEAQRSLSHELFEVLRRIPSSHTLRILDQAGGFSDANIEKEMRETKRAIEEALGPRKER